MSPIITWNKTENGKTQIDFLPLKSQSGFIYQVQITIDWNPARLPSVATPTT
jgi:hypothetical protein